MFLEAATINEQIVVDHHWNIKDLILTLEESKTIPEVTINGNKVSRESESYLSFLLDLSAELVFGENQMKIVKN